MSLLPRWKCHKEVRAAKIERVLTEPDGNGTLILSLNEGNVRGHTSIDMPPAWMERFHPQPGAYLVIYADGYHSVSPGQAFEEGYTRIDERERPGYVLGGHCT